MVRVSDELQQQQQQQPFNGRLKSGTTRVGRYQKKHSPAHTDPGQRTSFITFLHLQQSTACDELRCTLLCRASVGTLCTLYTRLLLLLFLHGLFFLSVVVSTYFLFRPHPTHGMRMPPFVTDMPWSVCVCLCVCPLVTIVSHTETAELISRWGCGQGWDQETAYYMGAGPDPSGGRGNFRGISRSAVSIVNIRRRATAATLP